MAVPRVLTPSGRQAQIKVVEAKTVVTGLDLSTNLPPLQPITEPFELGPCLDVVPHVAADGKSVRMTVIPAIKEFVGYEHDSATLRGVWDYVPSAGANPPPPDQQYPLPVFRLRQVVTRAAVWDGQTLVVFTRDAKISPPDGHPANKLPKELFDQISERALAGMNSPPKAMLVFITPRIVDAAGNAVHSDEELPARANSIPPQPPPR